MARTGNPASRRSLHQKFVLFSFHNDFFQILFDDGHLVKVDPVWVTSCVSHPMQIEHCGLAGLLLNYHCEKYKKWKKVSKKSVTSVGVMCHAAIFGESEASVKGMWITL